MSRVPPRRFLPALGSALLLGAAGCGAGSLTAGDVATEAEDALEQRVGVRPDVRCPADLPAEVGAETRCILTADGDDAEYGVTVRITSVTEGRATFDVQVDDRPRS